MNKNIKHIIALVLVINSTSLILPANVDKYFVGTKTVYASSYSPDDEQLKTLKIKSLDGETISLRDDYNGDTVKLSDDTEYWAKQTDDSDGIKITADVEGDGYVVKIFTSDSSSATAYDPGDEILIGKGDTTIYIRTYESKSAFTKVKDNVSECEEEYTINFRKTTESSYEDSTQDSIYLDSIELSKGDIDFVKGKTSYDIDVDDDNDSIWIKAIPEDDDDRVRINGSLVDSDDNYKKTISLDEGDNEIKVKITDSKDNQRTYTLNVTRGDDSDTQDSIYLDDLSLSEGDIDFSQDETSYSVDLDESIDELTITASPEDDDYVVKIDGDEVNSDDDYEKDVSLDKGENKIKVIVEDELNDKKRTYTLKINRGDAAEEEEAEDSDTDTETSTDTSVKKSQWVKTATGWEYHDKNGNKVTGWFEDNSKWYLLDKQGIMLTGWQYIDGKWYMLDKNSGEMKIGWYKEEVTTSQSNSTNSTTESKDNTNKTENVYYLNEDGSMKTGWLSNDSKWYYFNTNGIMQKGWLIYSNSKYYLDENGVMITGTKTIDGKAYEFTSNGVLII